MQPSLLAPLARPWGVSPKADCLTNCLPSSSLQAHEAVIKLRDNLRAEQHVVLEFAIAVFRGVFRARQVRWSCPC
jgi:hypothetical protein